MNKFVLKAPYPAAGDQPAAIEALANGVKQGLKDQVLLGVTGSGKTFTMASIIEKETGSVDESYNIASVFYNRLSNPASFPRLDSDATVHYAIGDYFGQVKELTQAHLDSNSPYNTRKATGLPPGAICCPGRDSLYAALGPNETNYFYFVYDPDQGRHLFAETYYEHQQNVDAVG